MAYVIKFDKHEITLPEFGKMPTGAIRKARHESDENKMWVILEEVLSEKDLAVLDKLPLEDFNKHIAAWTEGVSLGE